MKTLRAAPLCRRRTACVAKSARRRQASPRPEPKARPRVPPPGDEEAACRLNPGRSARGARAGPPGGSKPPAPPVRRAGRRPAPGARGVTHGAGRLLQFVQHTNRIAVKCRVGGLQFGRSSASPVQVGPQRVLWEDASRRRGAAAPRSPALPIAARRRVRPPAARARARAAGHTSPALRVLRGNGPSSSKLLAPPRQSRRARRRGPAELQRYRKCRSCTRPAARVRCAARTHRRRGRHAAAAAATDSPPPPARPPARPQL